MRTLIEKLFSSDYVGSIAITGGGTHALPMLLENGGGSNFLVDSYVPYSVESVDKFIYPIKVDKYASKEASWALAEKSYDNFNAEMKTKVAIGAAAKLTYEGERVGREHCIYVTVMTYNKDITYRITFNGRDRIEQEVVSGELIINAILHGLGLLEDVNEGIEERVEIV